ncbi:hypothetical protein BCR34DRAFT_171641 [Clohesyomyces aquaticus]|uniref:Uncharacterized protein n=1 Tax=Clohesyomyces aquaticus TaxID=1231657 RepID=A0A1Y1ZZB7_9PLEO|nr:hypothetical protein BCR34DRAFT_171641 [Clohesyomyces aquaticus]
MAVCAAGAGPRGPPTRIYSGGRAQGSSRRWGRRLLQCRPLRRTICHVFVLFGRVILETMLAFYIPTTLDRCLLLAHSSPSTPMWKERERRGWSNRRAGSIIPSSSARSSSLVRPQTPLLCSANGDGVAPGTVPARPVPHRQVPEIRPCQARGLDCVRQCNKCNRTAHGADEVRSRRRPEHWLAPAPLLSHSGLHSNNRYSIQYDRFGCRG